MGELLAVPKRLCTYMRLVKSLQEANTLRGNQLTWNGVTRVPPEFDICNEIISNCTIFAVLFSRFGFPIPVSLYRTLAYY